MARAGGNHHGRHDRQAIEAIGQVDGIAGTHDDQIAEEDEADDAQRIGDGLEKGNDQLQLCRPGSRQPEIDRHQQTDRRLPEILPARRQAARVTLDHLLPIVVPTDAAETDGDDHHHPHIAIAEVAPQQRGNDDGDQDQRAAHGRRSRLDQVRLRTILTHRLADLLRGQPTDDARAGDEGNDQRGHRREHGAQRDVAEDVECAHVLSQPLRQ
jgi:hypothetical protein